MSKNVPNLDDASANITNNIIINGGGNNNASYVTINSEPSLPNERVLTVTSNLSLVDGGPGNSVTVDLADNGVTPGSYTNSNVTVDSKGRVTGISNGSVGITTITTDSNLSAVGSGIVNLSLNNTTVVPGTYNYATVAVDSKGRITGANSNTPVTSLASDGNVTTSASNGDVTLALSNTGVTPGNYTAANITVDSKGRITGISNGGGTSFPISYTSPLANNVFLTSKVTGDDYARFFVTAGGNIGFGPGGSGFLPDIYLRRGPNPGEILISGSPDNILNGTLVVGQIRNTGGVAIFGGPINVVGNDIINGRVAQLESIQSPPSKLFLELNPTQAILYGKPFIAGTSSFAFGDIVFAVQPDTYANASLILYSDGKIGLGNGTAPISAFFKSASVPGSIYMTDTIGGINVGNSVFSAGTVRGNTITSPGNNLAVKAANGITATFTGSSSGSIAISTNNLTLKDSVNVVAIGGRRSVDGRTGNFIATDNSTSIAGTPGVDNNFECRFSNGYWLSTNSSNSTGMRMNSGDSSWSAISDAKTKQLHRVIGNDTLAKLYNNQGEPVTILDSLDKFELYEYHYLDKDVDESNDQSIVGPTTQSFYGSFGEFINKKARKHIYSGAFDPDTGECTSSCLKPGDEVELLNDRDEKTAMWLVIKALNNEIKELKSELNKTKTTLRNAIEVIKDLDARIK